MGAERHRGDLPGCLATGSEGLYEAAQLDGAGSFNRFRRITLPMIGDALFFTMLVLTINSCRCSTRRTRCSSEAAAEHLCPRRGAVLRDLPVPANLFTLPRGLKAVIDTFGNGGEHWEIIMAASLIATVPLIVLFAFAQRHILNGIASQGRKGWAGDCCR